MKLTNSNLTSKQLESDFIFHERLWIDQSARQFQGQGGGACELQSAMLGERDGHFLVTFELAASCIEGDWSMGLKHVKPVCVLTFILHISLRQGYESYNRLLRWSGSSCA